MKSTKKTYQVLEVAYHNDGDFDIVYYIDNLSYESALSAYRVSKKYAGSGVQLWLFSATEDGDEKILYEYYKK